jgi:hypothetical protein
MGIDVNKNEGRSRFLTFLYVLLQKINIFVLFLAVNASPTPLLGIGVYLVKILVLFIGQAEGHRFPLAGGLSKFYAGNFDHWPILCCLGLVRHQQQVNQLIS